MSHFAQDFFLTKIPFLKRLTGISRLIVEVLDNQNLFTESKFANWFSSYVQFCLGDHFSERAEAARYCGKMNHLKDIPIKTRHLGHLINFESGRCQNLNRFWISKLYHSPSGLTLM